LCTVKEYVKFLYLSLKNAVYSVVPLRPSAKVNISADPNLIRTGIVSPSGIMTTECQLSNWFVNKECNVGQTKDLDQQQMEYDMN
jgi:hypothetical protein